MKKLLAIILSVVMLLATLGTVAFSAVAEETTYNLVDVKDNIRTIGRTSYTDDGLYLAWTASGFEFSANCSGDVALTIKSTCYDMGNEGDHNKDLYFTVYIDGVRLDERLRVMNGTFTVNLAEDLSSGNHTFKVIKQNEFTATTCTVNSITMNGSFNAKPAAQKRVIEFIGDSITTGYASLAPGADDNAQRYSDGTRTYAYVTAENFDAEARVTAISGGTCSRLYNAYKYNVSNGTSDTPYDFSLTKPDVVVISLGGNDGLQTPEYWLNHFKNFTDMIREGYNDYSIPIIYAHNITQSHNPKLRSYVSAAFKTLKAQDPEKYSNFYMVSGGYASGHPRQDKHLFAAKKLTQCIVNNGILPIDELKEDATVTLTATNTEVETVESFDQVISITGATSEVVEALDPNDNGGALKFTTDGTQTAVAGSEFSIKADMSKYRYKGFGVYVNFKNLDSETEAIPYLQVKASDQKFIQPLEYSTEGETARFEVLWDDMADVGSTYIRGLCSTSNPIRFAPYISEGSYELTLDSLELLVNDYEVTDNANSTYKVLPLSSIAHYGVTENYNKAEATAATDVSGTFTFEAEDLTHTSNSGTGDITANNDYNCGKNKFVVLNSSNPQVGNYIEYTIPSLEAGTYKLSVPTRATPTRSSFDISVNGTTTASNVSFAYTDGTPGFVADYVSIDCGNITVSETGSVKLRFTISNAGSAGAYMDKIKFTLVSDGEEPSTEPSEEPEESSTEPSTEPTVPSESEEPSTEPSSATQGQTYTFEAEEIVDFTTNAGTGSYTANNDYNCGYNKFFVLDGTTTPVLGHYVEFTLPSVNAGTYKITVPTRASSNRSSFNISVNGVVTASNVSFAAPSADYVTFDCGTATISETGDVKIRFTISTATAAGAYIDKIILTPTLDSGETPTVPSEPVEPEEPETNGKNYYYVAATSQIPDLNNKNTNYYTFPVPTGDNSYTTEDKAKEKVPYVSDASWSKGVGTFYDIANGHCVTFGRANAPAVGDYVQFTFNLDAGIYNFYTYARSHNGRATAKATVSANGSEAQVLDEAYKQNANGDQGTPLSKNDLGYLVVYENTDIDVRFTVTSSGQMFFKAFMFEVASEVPEGVTPVYIGSAKNKYDVSIDGNVVSVEEGENYVLPTSNVTGFVAYTNGTDYFDAGEEIEITEDLVLTTVSAGETKMLTGASMRLKTPSGMRFYTQVDIDKIAALRQDGFTVSLGTLIAPEDLLGANELTHSLAENSFVDVKFNSDTYFEESDFVGVVGSLANIKDKNANRSFVGRGYIIATKGDYTKVIYADYANDDINNNKRTISWIATQVKASSLYETVSDVIKGYIDHYVALYKED